MLVIGFLLGKSSLLPGLYLHMDQSRPLIFLVESLEPRGTILTVEGLNFKIEEIRPILIFLKFGRFCVVNWP